MLEFENTLPSIEEYCELREVCGLSEKTEHAAELGLPNSLFATIIRNHGELIAMGRVVGDSGCNYEIVDVAVHPRFQQRGFGYKIMQAIMEFIAENAPPSAYVSLIADNYSPKLYSKFGFKPTAPVSIGMAFKVEKKK